MPGYPYSYTALGWSRPNRILSTTRTKILASVGIGLLVLILLVSQHEPGYPYPRPTHRMIPEVDLVDLQDATPAVIAEHLETSKMRLLKEGGFNSDAMAKDLKSPLRTGGNPSFTPEVQTYANRINDALATFNSTASWQETSSFPYQIFSTDKNGWNNLPPQFAMWGLLNQSLNLPDFPEPPAHKWNLSVADDDEMDRKVAQWVGTTGRWADFWAKLHSIPSPVLRADSYRYLAMLFEGGIYSDSDAAPLSHPFVWGVGAPSIVPLEIEEIREMLHGKTDGTLLSGISMVTSVECDISFAFTPSKWRMWIIQIARLFVDPCGRSLQFTQYILVSKPHHPVFVDTMETVRELVYAADFSQGHKGALDLTGPGPYSDSLFRYLLVNFGVRPEQLRRITRPVRVGDVLILPEESFLSWKYPLRQLAIWNTEFRDKPWYWGHGWHDWFCDTTKVVYHGLAGRWRGKGFG